MRKYMQLILCTFLVRSYTPSEDEEAARLLSQIKTLYEDGCYNEALDSIMALRMQFPKAIESRKEALHIWQNAPLKQVQTDITKADSALQTVLRSIPMELNLYKTNMMRVEHDSLKARYEAICGVMRMVRMRQKQGLQHRFQIRHATWRVAQKIENGERLARDNPAKRFFTFFRCQPINPFSADLSAKNQHPLLLDIS